MNGAMNQDTDPIRTEEHSESDMQGNTNPVPSPIPSAASGESGFKPEETIEPSADESRGMNFMEHLEEVRARLIKSVIALAVFTGFCTIYADFLVNDILIGPLRHFSSGLVLQNLVPYGQLSLYLQVVVFCGFVITFPFIAWQIWQFIAPGLHENERKAGRFSILFISLCFFSGIAFGYFVFLPVTLRFFASFGSPLIKNNISVQDYVSFFTGTLLTSGLVFELPFISYVLSKIGLLTPAFMRFYRKHAIVFLLVVAAVVTPSTDLVTQLVIGIPMILLYELSIMISVQVNRNNAALQS
jgi:sec-independent protein translocase protein TatC